MKIAASHTSTYVEELTRSLAYTLQLTPTMLNYKGYMLYCWPSKASAPSIRSPQDPLLCDATIRGLFIKLNRSRNSLPAAQFMLTLSMPFVESTAQSQE